MSIKPDEIYKCIKSFKGKLDSKKDIILNEGREYSKTEVHMSTVDPTRSDTLIFLREWDTNQAARAMQMEVSEFQKLASEYLQKVMDLK